MKKGNEPVSVDHDGDRSTGCTGNLAGAATALFGGGTGAIF